MPGVIDRYQHTPVTKEDCKIVPYPHTNYIWLAVLTSVILVDWAELITLDLSLYEQPGGKKELVQQLDHAVRHVGTQPHFTSGGVAPERLTTAAGFFYVKGFNIGQDEVDQQFALGREFYNLPLEEKLKFHSEDDLTRGEYNGYRPAGRRM